MPPPPYRICFVCLGNICRSPMAAVVLPRLVDDAGLSGLVQVDSAGTGSWHIGHGADPQAVQALGRRGYDGSAHVARQFTAADFADYDLVVGLDPSNVADLRRLAPGEVEVALLRDFDPATSPADRGRLSVPDPWGGSDAEFDQALELVLAACRGLLGIVCERLPDAAPSGRVSRH